MTNKYPFSDIILNLSDNFDDLLESLSTLQRLGELPAHRLTEPVLLENALEILHHSIKATRCSIYILPPSETTLLANAPLGSVLALECDGVPRRCNPTRIEDLFIRSTLEKGVMQDCDDSTTLDLSMDNKESESSIISVPLMVTEQLCGVITTSHSGRQHFNAWGYRLMELFGTFLGQQLALCRCQNERL
nr:GAF domain-containing protein [uncultured Desulfuromonas sp.]